MWGVDNSHKQSSSTNLLALLWCDGFNWIRNITTSTFNKPAAFNICKRTEIDQYCLFQIPMFRICFVIFYWQRHCKRKYSIYKLQSVVVNCCWYFSLINAFICRGGHWSMLLEENFISFLTKHNIKISNTVQLAPIKPYYTRRATRRLCAYNSNNFNIF